MKNLRVVHPTVLHNIIKLTSCTEHYEVQVERDVGGVPPRSGGHTSTRILILLLLLPCNQDSNNNYSPPKTREAYLIQKIKYGKGVI